MDQGIEKAADTIFLKRLMMGLVMATLFSAGGMLATVQSDQIITAAMAWADGRSGI
jgi:hypothetical protein